MGANQKLRKRTVWLLIIILAVGFGAVITRLAFLQLVQGEELQRRAIEQQLSDTPVSAKRGTIYDTKGKILAQSASVWQVVMAPAYFDDGADGDEQRHFVAKRLSEILGVDENETYEETKQNTYYVSVKRKVETSEKEQIIQLQNELSEKYQKAGIISLLDDYKRYYPYSDLASSVIGFTGSEDQGLSGVEFQYNDYLSGTPGRIVSAQNGVQTQMPFDYNQNIGAIDGSSLVLTIDETVQSIVEKYMKQGIIDHDVHERGVCIVMDVNNGEVLAMASVNGFDLNKPYTISDDQQKDIDAINIDLVKKKYYNANKVEAVLEDIKRQALLLNRENELLGRQLYALHGQKDEIGDTLLSAKAIAQQIIADAQTQAEKILTEARRLSREMTAEAERNCREANAEAEAQRREMPQRLGELEQRLRVQLLGMMEDLSGELRSFSEAEVPSEETAPDDLSDKVDAIARELEAIGTED